MARIGPGGTASRQTLPAGERGIRALDAMAKAARRASLAEQGLTAADQGVEPDLDRRAGAGEHDGGRIDRDVPATTGAWASSGRTGGDPPPVALAATLRARRRWVRPKGSEEVLRASVLVTAALVIVLGVLALGFGLSGGPAASPAGRHGVATPRARSAGGNHPATCGQHSSASQPGVAQPNSGQAGEPAPAGAGGPAGGPAASNQAAPGPAPVLDTVTPDGGTAGQVVTVDGSNLFSADASIQAAFAGQPTDIRCPTQTSCMVTVPLLAVPAGSIPVTVTTEAGTSNAIPFSYGSAAVSSCEPCRRGGPYHRLSGALSFRTKLSFQTGRRPRAASACGAAI